MVPPQGERPDTADPADTPEPRLTVRQRRPWFLRRRFLQSFAPVVFLALAGLVALLVSTNLRLPFEKLITFDASMGSKADFFHEERVGELLLQHHMRVRVIREGSCDGIDNLDSFDFIFPSGQPCAALAAEWRRAEGKFHSEHRPFISPIVLATYRSYAETLRAAGVAKPQTTPGFDRPYYYTLDMDGFLTLVLAEKSWADLNGPTYGVINNNKVLARTTNLCRTNSAATYVGLVSYAVHDRVPRDEEEAVGFATTIESLLDQGLPLSTPEIYFLPEGPQTAPIVVLYEHQYLAHQLDQLEQHGKRDDFRVLLHPDPTFQTQPQLVALNKEADRLGRLLMTDPDLRKRALELGLRVIDPSKADYSGELTKLLAERGMPAPSLDDLTPAVLPDVPRLQTMTDFVGRC